MTKFPVKHTVIPRERSFLEINLKKKAPTISPISSSPSSTKDIWRFDAGSEINFPTPLRLQELFPPTSFQPRNFNFCFNDIQTNFFLWSGFICPSPPQIRTFERSKKNYRKTFSRSLFRKSSLLGAWLRHSQKKLKMKQNLEIKPFFWRYSREKKLWDWPRVQNWSFYRWENGSLIRDSTARENIPFLNHLVTFMLDRPTAITFSWPTQG